MDVFDSSLSFMGFLSPAVFGEETSGREGRQSSGPNTEDDETGGGPLRHFANTSGHSTHFPSVIRFRSKADFPRRCDATEIAAPPLQQNELRRELELSKLRGLPYSVAARNIQQR